MKFQLVASSSFLILLIACSGQPGEDAQTVAPQTQERKEETTKQSSTQDLLTPDERRILKGLEEDLAKSSLSTSGSTIYPGRTSTQGVSATVNGCAPRTISGSGDTILDIPMQSACRFATAQHSGNNNFIVGALDSSGKRVSGIFNVIGRYSGQMPWNDSSESYQSLSVQADGPWTIDIR